MTNESDRVLIQQIRNGDDTAWTQLVARYQGRIFAFAVNRLRDKPTAEDVVQETFVGFLHSLPAFDDRRELQKYLFTIASYKITDQLRRQGRRPPHLSDSSARLSNQIDSGLPAASSIARSDERRDLERTAIAHCLGQMLREWLTRGEYLRVQVLELLLVKGWGNLEVARHLGIDEQKVANWRFAATRKLGESLRSASLSPDVFPELRGLPAD